MSSPGSTCAPIAGARGSGSCLLATALGWAARNGARRIVLRSNTRLTLSHALYRRYGFVQGGERECHDANASREYQFTLEL